MIKLFILLASTLPLCSFAQSEDPLELSEDPNMTPVISSSEAPEERRFDPRKSHWVVTFGFEAMSYDLPFSYEKLGKIKGKFKRDNHQLWGGRLGIGREFKIVSGLKTTTRIEGYYMATLFSNRVNAGPDINNEEFTYIKRTGQIYGADLTQTLSYVHDFRTKNPIMQDSTHLTLEPFVEAGIGRANGFNKVDYLYDTTGTGGLGNATLTHESYEHRVNDMLQTRKIGAGFNITASTGYFLFIKATAYELEIMNRTEKGTRKENTRPVQKLPKSPGDVDTISTMVYSIGGGYKF